MTDVHKDSVQRVSAHTWEWVVFKQSSWVVEEKVPESHKESVNPSCPALGTSGGHLRSRFSLCVQPQGGSCLWPPSRVQARGQQALQAPAPARLPLFPSPLPLPQCKHFCLSCLSGKSLPAERDRSPAALPPPRQHPSLAHLPLPALPPTLTPSAGA
jgi:hypothetical protein